jgi:hypothetical protein
VPAAEGPLPGVGVVVQGAGHHVGGVGLLELLTLLIIIMGHVQPEEIVWNIFIYYTVLYCGVGGIDFWIFLDFQYLSSEFGLAKEF